MNVEIFYLLFDFLMLTATSLKIPILFVSLLVRSAKMTEKEMKFTYSKCITH